MPSFNLIDEPWIPCVFADGGARELGVREALLRAPEIREIADPAPTITAALHRLLLAILHRTAGPASADDWAALWDAGRFDMAALDAYFDRWRHRFDLFAPERPFYQSCAVDERYLAPASRLTQELASAGNPVLLFDHTLDATLTPAQAARYLVACQAFSVGGLVSGTGQEKYADASPLTKTAVVLAKGENLFRTLMLNLVEYDPARDDAPFPVTGEDLPAWEQEHEPRPDRRMPLGYLDLLTWQSRRVRLYPEHDDEGIVVRGVVIMKGCQFADSWDRSLEPMLAFSARRKPAAGQSPWIPLAFQEDRAIWRDSLALMRVPEGYRQPRTLVWLAELVRDYGVLDQATIQPIDLYGVTTDQANVLFWRHERMSLPVAFLEDADLAGRARQALDLAEAGDRALGAAADELARLLLAPESDQQNGRSPDRAAVSALKESLAPQRIYWPSLEPRFKALLAELAGCSDDEERAEAIERWTRTVRRAAMDALGHVAGGLGESARALKAQACAERRLRRRLNEEIPIDSETHARGGKS